VSLLRVRLNRWTWAAIAALTLPMIAPAPALAEDAGAESGAESGNATSLAYFSQRNTGRDRPAPLDQDDARYYRSLFAAIHGEDWAGATARLAERDAGPLHDVARAELYLAANSPRVELGPLLALLGQSPDLPQAEQLSRLAAKRGATILPDRPQIRQLAFFGGIPRRGKPKPVADGTIPADMAARIQDRIVNDDPGGARALLAQIDPMLSADARTEWRQRVAWSYYIENQDREALGAAREALAAGGSDAWLAEAHWVSGLAAWRLGDCNAAGQGFDGAARHALNEELRAAGRYWAARTALKCRRPDLVAANLRGASQYDQTFYGILAAEQLGTDPVGAVRPDPLDAADWRTLSARPNVRRAAALAQIGETTLADEALAHEVRISGAADYDRLLKLARELDLVQTQLLLANNGPRGVRPDTFARFPSPGWIPRDGWRVDPALVFAHSLQESNFRTDARSAADARGLMQVRPGSASDMVRHAGETVSATDLYQPEVNLEYGQRYLEMLRDRPETQGLLPKVIAAYNAGATPVGRWNYEVRDGGDPLLFIESIPYYETRAYVGIILRNYWMYEREAGVRSLSALGLAEGLWPRFPTAKGVELVSLRRDRGD